MPLLHIKDALERKTGRELSIKHRQHRLVWYQRSSAGTAHTEVRLWQT